MSDLAPFSTAAYWERRYAQGGSSGPGSYGRLALYKAAFLNAFMQHNEIADVTDLGCGDGHLLSLLRPRSYLGVDVSETALVRCREGAIGRPECRFIMFDGVRDEPASDLALSIDVMFHLVEDDVFLKYLDRLFHSACRYVIVYASNNDRSWPAEHVRHRRFSERVRTHFPDWRLAAHVPNPFPFDPDAPDQTSFADFFVYCRAGSSCIIDLPGMRA